MSYLLDTNVFIQADKQYYSEKIVPSFWKFLEKEDDIFTLNQVIKEIKKGNDDLPELIRRIKIYPGNLDSDVSSDIADYINNKYSKEEAQKFLQGADFPLVCMAKSNNLILITQEKILGKGAKKVSIPNICKKFGIFYMDTFEMLKDKKINLSNY